MMLCVAAAAFQAYAAHLTASRKLKLAPAPIVNGLAIEQRSSPPGKAVALTAGRAKLEASGSARKPNLSAIAQSGIDYSSIDFLIKDCRATDLSIRIIKP